VDQYNACYGGQACGLCTLSWVESDRPLALESADGAARLVFFDVFWGIL